MSDDDAQSSNSADCAVCLQKCHHPTQLPCGHIFCFLCVKGVAIQNRKCAMCRAPIPLDYLDHPVLLEKLTKSDQESNAEEFQWYYEGRNGWWKYDERSSEELETAWNEGATECTLLLAGAVYCIHFANMIQTRRSDPTRRRHVRRAAAATLPAKGIAGIKIIDETKSETEETGPPSQISSNIQPDENNEVVIVYEGTTEAVEPDHNDNEIDYLLESLNTLNLEAPSEQQQQDT